MHATPADQFGLRRLGFRTLVHGSGGPTIPVRWIPIPSQKWHVTDQLSEQISTYVLPSLAHVTGGQPTTAWLRRPLKTFVSYLETADENHHAPASVYQQLNTHTGMLDGAIN
jgi:hypothetical protein